MYPELVHETDLVSESLMLKIMMSKPKLQIVHVLHKTRFNHTRLNHHGKVPDDEQQVSRRTPSQSSQGDHYLEMVTALVATLILRAVVKRKTRNVTT